MMVAIMVWYDMISFTFNIESLRSIFKLYGSGETLEELIQILKQYNVGDIVSVHWNYYHWH